MTAPVTSPPATGKGQRFAGLDGLRGLAALAIVFHHAGFQAGTTFDGWHGRFLGRLDVGVPVFFALSGFLLFMPIVSAVLDDRPLRPVAEHLWRRALRIYPAFWVALLCIVVFTSEAFQDVTGAVVSALLIHIHFPTHALGPMPQSWSLATEISFYAFLPLLARLARPWLATRDREGRRNGLFILLAIGYLLSVAFRIFMLVLDNRWTPAAVLWLPGTFDYFAIGMSLAVARVGFPSGTAVRDRLERWGAAPGRWWAAAAVLFVVVSQSLGLALGVDSASWDREIARQFLYGAISLCLLYPLVFGTDRDDAPIRRFLATRPVEWLGTISYSVYLWHLVFISHPFPPLESLVGDLALFDRRFWPTVLVAIIPTLVVSWVSYLLIERGGQKLQGLVRRPVIDPTPTERLVTRLAARWRSFSFRAQVTLIATAGLAFRVVYVVVSKRNHDLDTPNPFPGDQFYYSLAADALAAGDGFVLPWQHVVDRFSFIEGTGAGVAPHAADHPPLTAIVATPASFLPGGRGDHVFEQRLLMCLVGAAVIVAIGYLGRALAGRAVGLIAAGLAAAHPGFWINDGLVMAETLTTLMTALLLLAVVHYRDDPNLRRAGMLGVWLGLAALARSESLLLAILVVVPLVWTTRRMWRTRVRDVAVAGAVTVLVISPWVVPNLVRFDEPVTMSTNDGLTLIGANSPETYDGGGVGFWNLAYKDRLEPTIPELVDADPSVQSRIWREQAFEFIGDNLSEQPRVMTIRLGRLWSVYRPFQMAAVNTGEGREVWASNLTLLGLGVIAPLGIVGFWRLGVDRRLRWPIAALVVHVSLVGMLFYGIPRFRVPAEVGLVVATAVAIHWLASLRASRPAGAEPSA